MVDTPKKDIREAVWRINDTNLLMERKTFVKNSKGKRQAMGSRLQR
jgi:hypothetical protein